MVQSQVESGALNKGSDLLSPIEYDLQGLDAKNPPMLKQNAQIQDQFTEWWNSQQLQTGDCKW
jgi:hypothetical protein